MKALGLEPLIHAAASVRSSQLGAYTEIGARTSVIESKLGDYSYVVNDSDVIYSTIGKFCSIASHVRINPGNHPMHRASQAHFTYRSSMYFPGESDEEEFFDWRRDHQVTIGHDVWIGHGAIVLPGRAVGAGAVVAGGAIVMKDVPEYRVVAGNPARPMRERFCPAISERLLSLAWWDWDHDRLCRALPDFRALSIEAFLEKYSAD